MGIRYEQDTPLKEYMGVYQIPATLADCVEQYRLDCIQNVDQNTKISELDYSLIIDPGQQGYDNAFALYDPLGYFGDTTLSALPPKTTASIPRQHPHATFPAEGNVTIQFKGCRVACHWHTQPGHHR